MKSNEWPANLRYHGFESQRKKTTKENVEQNKLKKDAVAGRFKRVVFGKRAEPSGLPRRLIMGKKIKMDLNDLKVESFVTSLEDDNKAAVKGGRTLRCADSDDMGNCIDTFKPRICD